MTAIETPSTGSHLVPVEHHLPERAYSVSYNLDEAPDTRVLPMIVVGERDLRDVTADAIAAMVESNRPVPSVFRYGTSLARLLDTDGQVAIETMNQDRLTNHLGLIADWRTEIVTRTGVRYIPRYPDPSVIRDILAMRDWPLPRIERVVQTPVFAPDGFLVKEPGYHPDGRVYLTVPVGLQVPPIPHDPTPAEVAAAKLLLQEEAFGDFPFVTDADRAHAVAAALLPFTRAMIAGPTPLHLINAPTKGTGKSLLAQVVTRISAGSVGVSTEARSEDEWRKRIGAWLSSGPPAIWLDNLKKRLDTGALAAVLTEDWWSDRLLGRNDATIRYPNRALWIGTGNGVTLSDELTRRTVPIHLDSGLEDPFLPEAQGFQFRHSDLRGWVADSRGMLIWACCTLVQRWISDGQPLGTKTIGSFESWARVMGGILGTVGIDGFLGNLTEFYRQADPETAAWKAFVQRWWSAHADSVVRPGELLVTYDRLYDDFLGLGDRDDRIRATALGNRLLAQRDRIFTGYRVTLVDNNQGGNRWRLKSEA